MTENKDGYISMAPPRFHILGVDVNDVTIEQAISLLEDLIVHRTEMARSVYFANANTLNLACRDLAYREVLQRGDYIFADGIGLQWATRIIYGVRLKDNVNGTDLVPELFRRLSGKGYRYFLLGATERVIGRAVENIADEFPGWSLVGYHHGYVDRDQSERLVSRISDSGADLLLVGMGNPNQEFWIDEHLNRLRVPLCIGVGGLFSYWANDLKRAPVWIRNIGFEWLYLLSRQPYKFLRYALGNPLFLLRVVRQRLTDRSVTGS